MKTWEFYVKASGFGDIIKKEPIVNYPKYPAFFKELNAGFSTQVHGVPLTNNWFIKRHVIIINKHYM